MAPRARQEKPERSERRVRIRPLYILLVIVLAFFAFKFIQKTNELQALNREATAIRAQNQQIIRDNARLRHEKKYSTTTRYLEEQARSLLGYTRPGEIAIVPRFHRATPVLRQAPRVTAVAQDPTWKQWLHVFTG